MSSVYNKGLFIFRRDLRIVDNSGLYNALDSCDTVIPAFIFDPRQVSDDNDYRSWNAIQFMIASLKELHDQLKDKGGRLYLFYGDPEKIIKKLIKDEKVDAVFCNRDYTPFSIKRDAELEKECIQHKVAFMQSDDSLLIKPEEIETGSGGYYTVFTPFYKKAIEYTIEKPHSKRTMNLYSKAIASAETTSIYSKIFKSEENEEIHVHGGRREALKILKRIDDFKKYKEERDFPSISTTGLSAHNKFGTVSIREVYYAVRDALGKKSVLLQQLFWRDFFTHVAYNAPYVFGNSFREKYDKVKWNKSKNDFQRWCEGKTGFPIVDAGMRQLNATGYMHNRARMIVGSFLTKDLLIDWRWGEKYFAQNLVDYDPCVNNGSWQWVASTGCDAQPYFRIFNPWTQQKKFDEDCEYIKTWVPELKKFDPKRIHTWFKAGKIEASEYPLPMVDHAEAARRAKDILGSV